MERDQSTRAEHERARMQAASRGFRIAAGPMNRAIQTVADTTIAALLDARPLLACKHVLNGDAGRYCCAAHPGAGIICGACWARHWRRHTDDVERQCDRCGDIVPRIHGAASGAIANGIRVRDTAGRSRPLHGQVLIGAIGFCPPCAADLEHEAA